MQRTPSTRWRARWRVACALAVVVAVAGFLAYRLPGAAHARPGDGVYQLDDGDLRFTYQAVTNLQGLFDLRSDRDCLRNLARTRPADTARLRAKLLERYRAETLEDLRDGHREQIALLESLGYL